jgi:hypothetical protein
MSWRCFFLGHRLEWDFKETVRYLDEHQADGIGWPNGAIPHFCSRCGWKGWA